MLEQHDSNDNSGTLPPDPAAGNPGARLHGASVLRIVAGLHAGATRSLAEQEMLVVGSGDDCDIVLADAGVALHHALITLVNGAFTLRALDAPLRIDGKPLHPGDPAELKPMQRIDLGEAAIALGSADEKAWSALFPAVAGQSTAARGKPMMRRLPMLAASTVLILTVAAVAFALLPQSKPQVDTQAFLRSLIPQYRIMQAKTSAGPNGIPVLSGTVESDATRSKIEQQLNAAGVAASLNLRTGEGMARDVAEVFRAQGKPIQARYLGSGTVELNGAIDQETLQKVMESSAMKDVGVTKFVAGKQLTSTSPLVTEGVGKVTSSEPPVDIVSVVRGKEPYVVDANGVQYPVGDRVPGHGTLIVVGKQVWVQTDSGEIKVLRPVTAAELAARVASESDGASSSKEASAISGEGAPSAASESDTAKNRRGSQAALPPKGAMQKL